MQDTPETAEFANRAEEAQQDLEAQQLSNELTFFADQLTWNDQRQYWQVADLRALNEWLATHRTQH